MARWDLSKLPEGRKPLPDEWFAERAQMQERIKGLEADLAKAVGKLLGAAEQLDGYVRYGYGDEFREAVAELTGGKDGQA